MDDRSDTPLAVDADAVFPNPRDPDEVIDRRQFLAVSAASAALAAASGCSPQPASHGELIPYVEDSERLTPGIPLTLATAMELDGAALGLLVTSREGRPTKIEGNPDHTGSQGSSDLISQAAILGLYDPDRSKHATRREAPVAWDDVIAALRPALDAQRATAGSGLGILCGATTSPSLDGLRREFLERYPKAKWVCYEPCGRDAALEGTRRAFGAALRPVFDFSKADVVLALDDDFLACRPGQVRYQRDYADRRRVRAGSGTTAASMNRLYAVESMLTATGACADHRIALKPSMIEPFAQSLAAELNLPGIRAGSELPHEARARIAPLAHDLRAHKGRCLVLVGDGQPSPLHTLGHAINHALGNIGRTVRLTDWNGASPSNDLVALQDLVRAMVAGTVEVLLILASNPVYTAPCDLPFAEALRQVKLSLHLGLYRDETAAACEWHIPESHFLEAWGDVRGHDGTVLIQQPLINPLHGGRSTLEFLAAILGNERPGRAIVREHWRKIRGAPADFDGSWDRTVQRGIVAGTALPEKKVNLQGRIGEGATLPASDSLEIQFRADPTLHDGRFGNNAWLQELPKPVTKLTWGNAAFMSPATAARFGIQFETDPHGGQHGGVKTDVIELRYRGRTVRAPAFVLPEHADGAVTVYLGHGRTHAGQVGNGVGFDAYRFRFSDAPEFDHGLEIARTGESATLACTQAHHSMEGRDPVRHTTAAEFDRNPRFIPSPLDDAAEKAAVTALLPPGASTPPPAAERDRRLVPLSLYQEWSYPGHKWAMAIDLSACTGCSACIVACQAENNIPVVGKDQVIRGREMHWLRVNRFAAAGRQFFQPVPCMHCENAPCEYVCPVGATVHSHDGLNDMVYNRCVGTRYCSNNCPYKVRRFNFLAFADFSTEALKPQRNPEVTVRSRGVMEKCTYCVQRIRAAEIDAETHGQPIVDGRIRTACEQACPSRAIVFGDLNDAASEVRKWKAQPHNYALLAELNTRPRTTYLAAIHNPLR
jgi:Fe-S-cluster-containing dehydrogenase component